MYYYFVLTQDVAFNDATSQVTMMYEIHWRLKNDQKLNVLW